MLENLIVELHLQCLLTLYILENSSVHSKIAHSLWQMSTTLCGWVVSRCSQATIWPFGKSKAVPYRNWQYSRCPTDWNCLLQGKYVTSRNLRDRLYRELERNLAMKVEDGETADTFVVSGRGTLHITILIENMWVLLWPLCRLFVCSCVTELLFLLKWDYGGCRLSCVC